MSRAAGVPVLHENARVRGRPTLRRFLLDEMRRLDLQSTYELADCLGVSQGTAWRLLKGGHVPRETTLVRIATAFDVSITQVRKLANRAVGEPEPFGWPTEFNQLPQSVRDLLTEFGWAYLHGVAQRVTRPATDSRSGVQD